MTPSDPKQSAASQPLLARALAGTANAIFITDVAGKIVWVNNAFSRLSGYSVNDSIGHTPDILHAEKQADPFYAKLWQTIHSGHVWQGEIIDKRKDGSEYTVEQVITPLLNDEGTITHFIAIQHDITQRKKESEREHHLAYHDVLTGLPNRTSFVSVLQHAISQARRTNQMLATLFLDLDKFKPINDALGHQTGDQLLAAIAERLRSCVRQADIVSRFGGDEFAILLNDLPDTEVAAGSARKLMESVSKPFVLRGRQIDISTSIGIAVYPSDGEDGETLLMNADKAMYQAKCQGGNRYQIYSAALSSVH